MTSVDYITRKEGEKERLGIGNYVDAAIKLINVYVNKNKNRLLLSVTAITKKIKNVLKTKLERKKSYGYY